jgi:hypothetical protein
VFKERLMGGNSSAQFASVYGWRFGKTKSVGLFQLVRLGLSAAARNKKRKEGLACYYYVR